MKASELLRGWTAILAGRPPFLSIEITKECPLRCPGCYAYGEEHLGGEALLRQVRDFKGKALVDGVVAIVDAYRPLHVSIVGGEPLIRVRELHQILPQIAARGIGIQVVTSAVVAIPPEWAKIPGLSLSVSIDGLPAEHDKRRHPATYERILRHIEGHHISVHCTISRQMTTRPDYLSEFLDFWTPRKEVTRVWMSIFTPQIGERSEEIVPGAMRARVIEQLFELRNSYPKLDMPKEVLHAFAKPPSDPAHCIFAQATRTITADLKTRITPCQFGGKPDCSQCGCMASAGMTAIGRYRLPGGVRLESLFQTSMRIGNWVSSSSPNRAA